MEESQSSANTGLDRSEQTGETLRLLRKQADQTLDSHRRRLVDIESDLSKHFKQITEELARDRVVDELEVESSHRLQSEFQRCREMLIQVEGDLDGLRQEAEDNRAEIDQQTKELEHLRERHQQSENECAELVSQRDQLQETLSLSQAELESLRSQLSGEVVDHEARLAEQRVECERLGQKHKSSQAERDRLSSEIDQLQETLVQAQENSETLEDQLSALSEEHGTQLADRVHAQEQLQQEFSETWSERNRLAGELEQIGERYQQIENEQAGLSSEKDQLEESLHQSHAEIESLRSRLSGEAVDHESCLAELQTECEQLQQQDEAGQTERDRLSSELDQLRKQISNHSEAHEAQLAEQAENQQQLKQLIDETQLERDRLAEQLEHLREQNHEMGGETVRLQEEIESAAQLRDQLQSAQEELGAQQEQYHELKQSLESAEANHETSATQLQEAQQRILELEGDQETNEQLDDLQHKFDLAIAEVEKLKQESAELNEELIRRAEADEQESPESEGLRAERDALATRIEELENAPPVEAENYQEVSDLERRYEMAVEDVRQLKQDNTSLQQQLSSIPTAAPAVVDEGAPLDWQAQKALLMAELEAEENGGVAPERRETLTSIEGTISITDRVVAEKDQEISELRQQLGSRPTEEPIVEEVTEPHAELFDEDALIQAERTRLEKARVEMEKKLREAEIEISVKRATLAREQAALEEKLAQISEESTLSKDEESKEAEEPSTGKPRRRWLSALGLKEDDEEK